MKPGKASLLAIALITVVPVWAGTATEVERLLREKPQALGLAVPSMPSGSPGMETMQPVPYSTLLVQPDGSTRIFASH